MQKSTEVLHLTQFIEELIQNNQTTSHPFENKLSQNFIYYKLNLSKDWPDSPIKTLRLLFSSTIQDRKSSINYQAASLVIKYKGGAYKTIDLSEEQSKKFESLMESCGAERKSTYAWKYLERTDIPGLPITNHGSVWLNHTASDYYAVQPVNPTAGYEELHQEIINYILNEIPISIPVIVDAGCGDTGHLLKSLEQALISKKIDNFYLMGFDFNSENIEQCRAEYQGNCQFFVGNVNKIDKILKTKLPESSDVILTLSGVLTRFVMEDSFEAVKILKQIAQFGKVKYLIGGGWTSPLFTNYIAKQIGYNPCETSYHEYHFFVYERMTLEEIITHRLKKLAKYNILDISLSPDPLTLLTHLKQHLSIEKQHSLVLDISFNKLTPELMIAIKQLLEEYPQIALCYWQNDCGDVFNFVSTFSGNAFIRSLSYIKDEGYLMASRLFFSRLHNKNFFQSEASSVKQLSQIESVFEAVTGPKPFILDVLYVYIRYTPALFDPFVQNIKQAQTAHENVDIEWLTAGYFEPMDGDRYPCEFYQVRAELSFKIKNFDQDSKLVMKEYIADVIKKIFEEQRIELLPILIKILHSDCSEVWEGDGYYFWGQPQISLSQEIEIYYNLATVSPYNNYFSNTLMRTVANRRLEERSSAPDFEEAKEAFNKWSDSSFCLLDR